MVDELLRQIVPLHKVLNLRSREIDSGARLAKHCLQARKRRAPRLESHIANKLILNFWRQLLEGVRRSVEIGWLHRGNEIAQLILCG